MPQSALANGFNSCFPCTGRLRIGVLVTACPAVPLETLVNNRQDISEQMYKTFTVAGASRGTVTPAGEARSTRSEAISGCPS